MTSRLRILVVAGLVGGDEVALARGAQLRDETGGELVVLAARHVAENAERHLLALGADAGTMIERLDTLSAGDVARFAAHAKAGLVVLPGMARAGLPFSHPPLEALEHALHCPLLVAKARRPQAYRRVLVGVHHDARCALSMALAIAPIAHFTLLRVKSFPGGYVPDTLPEIPPDDEVAAFLGNLVLPHRQHRWLVRAGKPKAELLFTAHEEKADLVVMGNTHRIGLERALLGNIALEAAETLTCDVLIAHAKDRHP